MHEECTLIKQRRKSGNRRPLELGETPLASQDSQVAGKMILWSEGYRWQTAETGRPLDEIHACPPRTRWVATGTQSQPNRKRNQGLQGGKKQATVQGRKRLGMTIYNKENADTD